VYHTFPTHAPYVVLAGIKDNAMRLTEARTVSLSHLTETIAVAFSDHQERPEFPDFRFAVTFPRTWSSEQIRMDLFRQVAIFEREYRARQSERAENPR
jgi:hypothetical protein